MTTKPQVECKGFDELKRGANFEVLGTLSLLMEHQLGW
jgi:hypothetical protein